MSERKKILRGERRTKKEEATWGESFPNEPFKSVEIKREKKGRTNDVEGIF